MTEAHSLAMTDMLAQLRKDLRRRPGDLLHTMPRSGPTDTPRPAAGRARGDTS
jgi:hypothetical protein